MKTSHFLYGIVALILIGASYMVWKREQPRPGQEIVVAAETRKSKAEMDLATAMAQPKLPILAPTWTKVRLIIEGCGLGFRPIKPDEMGDAQVFSGPAKSWHAVLNGPPLGVLACIALASEDYPIWLDAIAVSPNDAQLVISVLGRNLEERVQ